MNLDNYVEVKVRLAEFRQKHPDFSLFSDIIVDDGKRILMRAEIRDCNDRLIARGHAEEIRGSNPVNRTSAIENCETSAWGRALAAMGYSVDASIASKEEMAKVSERSGPQRAGTPDGSGRTTARSKASTAAQPQNAQQSPLEQPAAPPALSADSTTSASEPSARSPLVTEFFSALDKRWGTKAAVKDAYVNTLLIQAQQTNIEAVPEELLKRKTAELQGTK